MLPHPLYLEQFVIEDSIGKEEFFPPMVLNQLGIHMGKK